MYKETMTWKVYLLAEVYCSPIKKTYPNKKVSKRKEEKKLRIDGPYILDRRRSWLSDEVILNYLKCSGKCDQEKKRQKQQEECSVCTCCHLSFFLWLRQLEIWGNEWDLGLFYREIGELEFSCPFKVTYLYCTCNYICTFLIVVW